MNEDQQKQTAETRPQPGNTTSQQHEPLRTPPESIEGNYIDCVVPLKVPHYATYYKPIPSAFVNDIFKAQAFGKDRSLKRSQTSVQRLASEQLLIEAAQYNNYRLFKANGEYIFLSKTAEIEWLVP